MFRHVAMFRFTAESTDRPARGHARGLRGAAGRDPRAPRLPRRAPTRAWSTATGTPPWWPTSTTSRTGSTYTADPTTSGSSPSSSGPIVAERAAVQYRLTDAGSAAVGRRLRLRPPGRPGAGSRPTRTPTAGGRRPRRRATAGPARSSDLGRSGPSVQPGRTPTTSPSRRATTTNGRASAGRSGRPRRPHRRRRRGRTEHGGGLGVDQLAGGELHLEAAPAHDDRRGQGHVGHRHPTASVGAWRSSSRWQRARSPPGSAVDQAAAASSTAASRSASTPWATVTWGTKSWSIGRSNGPAAPAAAASTQRGQRPGSAPPTSR